MSRRQSSLFPEFDVEGTDLGWFENEAIRKGYTSIAGVDEVGRGPLAGPVISAAIILPSHSPISGINDSKKLTPKRRAALYETIYDQAVSIGLGIVDPIEIDRINILQASLLSMAMAVENLYPQPDYLLIDGPFRIPSHLAQAPIVKGDSRSRSIAAASIVAKVSRDRLMERYHEEYPQFGFDANKGYPTQAHREAIQRFGSCPIHRCSFKGVKQYL